MTDQPIPDDLRGHRFDRDDQGGYCRGCDWRATDRDEDPTYTEHLERALAERDNKWHSGPSRAELVAGAESLARELDEARRVIAAVRRALDDELANLADDGARLSHSVVRRIDAALASGGMTTDPEHDAGWRGEHQPGSFLGKRDQRPVLTSHERNTAGNCRTCGTSYPCEVRRTGRSGEVERLLDREMPIDGADELSVYERVADVIQSMESWQKLAMKRGRVIAAVEALCDEIAADNSMQLAPGWMVRDACVAKVRAALASGDGTGERDFEPETMIEHEDRVNPERMAAARAALGRENEYCMCGALVKDHGSSDNHSPVTEDEYRGRD